MRINNEVKLDFDDVLIVPQRSSLDSRASVNLERTFKFRHSKRVLTCCPVIASNFDTLGCFAVAKALAKHKMLTALHKHYSVEELVKFFYENEQVWDYTFYTIGCNEKDLEKLQSVRQMLAMEISAGDETIYHDAMKDFPRLLCLDAANGYTENFVEHLRKVRALFPNAIILAGNVVTGNITEELILSGADIAKIGIGSGCFVPGSLVKTHSGETRIENIREGEEVLTHLGNYKKVNKVISRSENKKIITINKIKSTLNHEYYVLNKKFEYLVNDENINNYAEWIPAEDLTKNYFLLKIKEG